MSRTAKPKTDRSASTATSTSNHSLNNNAKKNQKKTVIFDDNIINAYLEAGGKSLTHAYDPEDFKTDFNLNIKNKNGDSLTHMGKFKFIFLEKFNFFYNYYYLIAVKMNSVCPLFFLVCKNVDWSVVDKNGNTALHIGEY